MKKPYFNRNQRVEIYSKTLTGAHLELDLSIKIYLRNIRRDEGFLAMLRARRLVVRVLNIKLLGRDAPRKWYQLF